eukprot:gene2628-3318_t
MEHRASINPTPHGALFGPAHRVVVMQNYSPMTAAGAPPIPPHRAPPLSTRMLAATMWTAALLAAGAVPAMAAKNKIDTVVVLMEVRPAGTSPPNPNPPTSTSAPVDSHLAVPP